MQILRESGWQLPIAIQGPKTDVITMNAGDSIVEKLKENKSLGWQFVSEEKAKEGVQAGDYYAAIVIPGFSSSLVSILSGDLKRPKPGLLCQ